MIPQSSSAFVVAMAWRGRPVRKNESSGKELQNNKEIRVKSRIPSNENLNLADKYPSYDYQITQVWIA